MALEIQDFSIRGVCDLVGIQPAKKTFAEVFSVNASDGVVLRLARQTDATCLYVRLEAE